MVRIVIPWPAREVFPNYRQSHHWTKFDRQRKAQRNTAHGLTLEATTPEIRSFFKNSEGRIRLHVTFIQPDRRNRDDDGMVGAFKSARDGIADALGIDDSRFRPVYHFADEPEKPGKIIVRVG